MRIPKKKLSYYDLQDKKLILWGEEKIRLDAADFFGDLDIAESLPFDGEITDADGKTVVICSFSPQEYIEKLKRKELNFITIDEMISTVDEIDLYNNAVNHRNKKIIVFGEEAGISLLIKQNPNLKIDYIVNDICAGGRICSAPVKLCSELLNERSGSFRIICAMNPDKVLRSAFNKLGLSFGKDFYFHFDGGLIRSQLPSPSQLLRKTMSDSPKYNMDCKINDGVLAIHPFSALPCCNSITIVALESFPYIGLEDMVSSVFFRIMQLSTTNRTYSLCVPGNKCYRIGDKKYLTDDEKSIRRGKYSLLKPQEYTWSLNYDDSCNLKCRTCRTHFITKPTGDESLVDMTHKTVVENINLMPKFIFGGGEMLYGKYNKDILFNCNPYKEIDILTNGTLFNEENWQKIRAKYDRIKSVNVSVDAASKEMYKIVRGADFDVLLKNLRMLSELRKKNEIEYFMTTFTITTVNFREMKDWVLLMKELQCDNCLFQRVRCFRAFKPEELYIEDVYDERNPRHKEFLTLISDPVFKLPNVKFKDKRGIEHIFEQKKEAEQCQ
ncbi:MAG: radical SAM protein [Chitinivibrionia bacterium]|nr:radical SAM protein [Chitinivibrionia bacterium]